jgi:light-regulated signal transduction histidine kinase (bacteriophytochrome)
MNKQSAREIKDLGGTRRTQSSATQVVSRSMSEDESRRLAERISALEADLAVYRSALDQSRSEMQAFAYSVSHDLRAPLRAIEGVAKILADDFSAELGSDAKRFLKNIVNNTDTLSSQIEDLLRFYRLGKNPPTRINVDSGAIAAEAVAMLPAGAANKVQIHGSLPHVSADPVHLREIFGELLRNAVKFSANVPQQKIDVRATTENDAVRFSISDNGVGFDSKYCDRLFQVFQKLHPPSEFSGNGIGLAIVKRLVQSHGGCVEAQAVTNEGATFSFTLPQPKA